MTKYRNIPAFQFRRFDEKGVAAVEFALISATLVLVFVATFQVLLLLRTSSKLNTLTGNIAAMVAMQSPAGTVATAALADICRGAIYGLSPYPANGLTVDIASVTVTAVGSKADYWETDLTYAGGGCSATASQVIGGAQACSLAGQMLPSNGAIGDNAIIVRATLTYPGFVGFLIPSSPTLTQTAFTRWNYATGSTEFKSSGATPTSESCAG